MSTKRFPTLLSTKLETAFLSFISRNRAGWLILMCTWCILNAFPFNFLQRNKVIWEIPHQAIFCCSTFDQQCWQYRYLVILLYDGILRGSAGWSPHIQCFLRCNSFALTLSHLSWTTTVNCDTDWVCLGYMSISISSLSGESAWKNLEIKGKWTNHCMSLQFQTAFWSSVAL